MCLMMLFCIWCESCGPVEQLMMYPEMVRPDTRGGDHVRVKVDKVALEILRACGVLGISVYAMTIHLNMLLNYDIVISLCLAV